MRVKAISIIFSTLLALSLVDCKGSSRLSPLQPETVPEPATSVIDNPPPSDRFDQTVKEVMNRGRLLRKGDRSLSDQILNADKKRDLEVQQIQAGVKPL